MKFPVIKYHYDYDSITPEFYVVKGNNHTFFSHSWIKSRIDWIVIFSKELYNDYKCFICLWCR